MRRGSRVVMIARNSLLPIGLAVAAAQLGGQVIPLSPHSTPKELAYVLADSGAAAHRRSLPTGGQAGDDRLVRTGALGAVRLNRTRWVTLASSAEWLTHRGTVGRGFLGSEIAVYDDTGRRCPPGVVGEVYARMHGTPDFTYLGRSDARKAIERDGLISAGDIGELDADGFL